MYVTAPRREDYGLAQLEALADGAMLVTTEAPGPYAALPIARDLDARLVGDDLAGALRAALEDPREDYAERARTALLPFRRGSVDALVQTELLPRLLPVRGQTQRNGSGPCYAFEGSDSFFARLRSLANCFHVRVLAMSFLVSHARRAVATP